MSVAGSPIVRILDRKTEVPQPNNAHYPPSNRLLTTFIETPSFPRVDMLSDTVATRGNHQPVWVYEVGSDPDTGEPIETRTGVRSLSELLASFRNKINAQAIFLINDRGRLLARAGDLYDSSMEVSLLSALMAIFSAGLKVSRFIRQDRLESYSVFRGGDHDLILIPVNSGHALLLAGNDIANPDRILPTLEAMLFVRGDVDNILRSLGVATTAPETEIVSPELETRVEEQPDTIPLDVDVDLLFNQKEKIKTDDLDAFWDDAVEKHGNIPLNPARSVSWRA